MKRIFGRELRMGIVYSALSAFSVLSAPVLAQLSETMELSALKQLSIEELTNMEVISVTKHPKKLIKVASAIQVITQSDIRNSGATTLSEALRLAPNLQVAQANASQWAISARGFNNVLANKLLVLIDGRVVYTPMYAGVFWDVQNLLLEDIERIEVISGPGGTLWGANAVNGVINIITKDSEQTKGLFAEAAAGTELRGLGSIRYGGAIGENLTYRIYGTGFRRDNTIFRDSVDANDKWGMGQGGVRLDWNPAEKDKISFISNIYDAHPHPDGEKANIARGQNVLTRWQHTISGRANMQLQTFLDHTWRDFRNDFTERLYTYDIEAQHRFQAGSRQEVVYGLGFRYMDHIVTNIDRFGFDPEVKKLHIYNAFIQNEITLAPDWLNLILGIKLEHSTYAKLQFQPNARLIFTPGSQHSLWVAASRAVRTPARLDRDFFLKASSDLAILVGSEIESEEVVSYELGWRSQPKNAVAISISSFYNLYDDIRSVEPGPPPLGLPYTLGNGVKGTTYGAELSAASGITKWWHLRGGGTLLKKDLRVKEGSGDLNKASAESNDPKYQLFTQSSMDLKNGIGIGVVFRYIGDLPRPSVPGYAGLDIRLSWRFTKILEASVVGQNLIKEAHTEFIPSSPEPKDIERGVYGKIVLRLQK